jgi:hypothetical protein
MILEPIIKAEPVYAQLFMLETSTSGCDLKYCSTSMFLYFIVGIVLIAYAGMTGILYVVYAVRVLFYLDPNLPKSSYQTNRMLLRVLTVQVLCTAIFVIIPLAILVVPKDLVQKLINLDMGFMNIAEQLAFMIMSTYPICEILALLYFIKPYRNFIRNQLIFFYLFKKPTESQPIHVLPMSSAVQKSIVTAK